MDLYTSVWISGGVIIVMILLGHIANALYGIKGKMEESRQSFNDRLCQLQYVPDKVIPPELKRALMLQAGAVWIRWIRVKDPIYTNGRSNPANYDHWSFPGDADYPKKGPAKSSTAGKA